MTIYIFRCIIKKHKVRENLSNQKGGTKTKKRGEPVDDKEKQTKELLEVLKKALESEAVERITITIKPNKKPKQS